MTSAIPKSPSLALTMKELLSTHSAYEILRALVSQYRAQRLALRQSRPPPIRAIDLSAYIQRDLGLHEPRD